MGYDSASPRSLVRESVCTRGWCRRVRIFRSAADLEPLRRVWDLLAEATPLGTGFQSFGWIRACLDELPQDGHRPYVLVAERGGTPIGIAPMLLSRDGTLSFIGAGLSNYVGPLAAEEDSAAFLDQLRHHIATDPAIRSVVFAGLRGGSPLASAIAGWQAPGWGPPRIVAWSVAPECDLSIGWTALMGRHKARHRLNWNRQAKRLAAIGSLEFGETQDADEIRAALPELFRLYDVRWAGRWTSGSFSDRHRAFHAAAAGSGVERLSTLRLDGHLVAASLGIRLGRVTTSYVVAHDDRFRDFSPGKLLLLRILEAAASRGDPAYDFSLGDMPYKAVWADRQREVIRVYWGRWSRLRAARSRLWVEARSIGWLREAKVNGPHAVRRLLAAGPRPGSGRPAGSPSLTVQRASAELPRVSVVRRRLSLAEMECRLAPAQLRTALGRAYLGDYLYAISSDGAELGTAWLAGESRRVALRAAVPSIDGVADCWYDLAGVVQGAGEPSGAHALALALLAQPGTMVAGVEPITDERLATVGDWLPDLRAASA